MDHYKTATVSGVDGVCLFHLRNHYGGVPVNVLNEVVELLRGGMTVSLKEFT